MRREYRPPEEVFSERSIATLRGATVTDLHPVSRTVDAMTWRQLAVGYAGEDIRQDGIHVAGTLYVQDAETIARIEAGERPQVSLGYDQDLDLTPGITPEGEEYDAVQRNISYNHIALVPRGRAGATVGLRLDQQGHEIPPGVSEVKIKIGSKEYDAGSPEAQAAIEALSRRADAAEAEARTARKSALVEGIKRLPAKLGVRTSFRFDEGEDVIMLEVLKKIAPNFSVEGKTPEFILGAFALGLEMALGASAAPPAAEEPEPVDTLDAPPPGVKPEEDKIRADVYQARSARNARAAVAADPPPDVVARQKMIERGANRALKGE